MFLSVIIPCYRETEEQLTRCLDSLAFLNGLCQWEAWIIDDGSPQDAVTGWVDARHDIHLHVVRQPNQGQSVARNKGIELATGRYLAFLDADDEWIPTEYARIIRILLDKQPDLLGLRCKRTRVPYYEGDALLFMASQDIIPMACGYIVRRDVLGTLRYTPGIYHEDEEFNTHLHLQAHSLIMTPIVAYRYHHNPQSTVRSTDPARLAKRFSDLLGVVKRIQQLALNAPSGSLEAFNAPSGSLEAKALERRLHVIAMCYVADLFRSAPDAAFLHHHLDGLRHLGLFPLPPYPGIHRYVWIRLLSRWTISYHLLHWITG